MDINKIALRYFEAVESRSHEAIMALFDQNCEVFFANFGVIKGYSEFDKVNQQLIKHFKELIFRKEAFILTTQENRVVVEGVEYGELANGTIVKENRLCNVFEINPDTGLIKRMFAYTDPHLGLEA